MTETEDAQEWNAVGRRGWKKEGERAVRDNGVVAFICLGIRMREGGTERWTLGGKTSNLMG